MIESFNIDSGLTKVWQCMQLGLKYLALMPYSLQVREWDDLPKNAQKYVERVEELVGTSCTYIGVGPGRDAIVMRHSAQASKNGAKSLQPI